MVNLRIAGGEPGTKVSWQVTGIRQDAWANAHRIPVEEAKPADERGLFLHPVELSQPANARGCPARLVESSIDRRGDLCYPLPRSPQPSRSSHTARVARGRAFED